MQCNSYNYKHIYIYVCVCVCKYVCLFVGIAFCQFYFTSYLQLIQLVIILLCFCCCFFSSCFVLLFLSSLQLNIFHSYRIYLLLYKFILRFCYYFILVRIVCIIKRIYAFLIFKYYLIKTKIKYFRISKNK